MKHLLFSSTLVLAATSLGWAQNPPTTIGDVMSICTPVIDEEYNGDTTRWGTCVKATRDFLVVVYGPPAQPDPNGTNARLVAELVKLYRPQDCPEYETELPEAIEVALSFSTDPDQQKLMQDIADTISSCEPGETNAVDPVPASRS